MILYKTILGQRTRQLFENSLAGTAVSRSSGPLSVQLGEEESG